MASPEPTPEELAALAEQLAKLTEAISDQLQLIMMQILPLGNRAIVREGAIAALTAIVHRHANSQHLGTDGAALRLVEAYVGATQETIEGIAERFKRSEEHSFGATEALVPDAVFTFLAVMPELQNGAQQTDSPIFGRTITQDLAEMLLSSATVRREFLTFIEYAWERSKNKEQDVDGLWGAIANDIKYLARDKEMKPFIESVVPELITDVPPLDM